MTQGDGATVGLSEADDFVKGYIKQDFSGPLAGEEVMVKAIDFTTKGDDEEVNILIGGTQSSKIKKKHLTKVLVEKQELNEYGVYNSETDIYSNPKTKENTPDELTGFLSKLESSIKSVIEEIEGIKQSVMDDSKLSYDSFDVCISELSSYLKSINDESEHSASANPN